MFSTQLCCVQISFIYFDFELAGWKINFCHADEYDSEDEDNSIWAADKNLTGALVPCLTVLLLNV